MKKYKREILWEMGLTFAMRINPFIYKTPKLH